ncbi:putative nicotinate-nucleotide pyrophosphorylase [Methanobrevibacter cuticularis]|uniref:Nicotinate-nucleotide pyrophosphorylase [carboxylating] n=1 Tax=Methanobrevibacter cuticularis TaxID=47311 RepID=A0A166CUZ9_9EURY|nr:carboxylating nicotinate-nucleotide diphosphorylase [Methanobrevibacter cuticularis]KZX14891.1 putative nicotinate-nucleotide pyrophosphorylase [Methanobrevibacter cuticularis]
MDSIIEYIIEEDLGFGDITTELLVPENMIVTAKILAKEQGIVAGVKVVKKVFEDMMLSVKVFKEDESKIAKGDTILEVRGSARNILTLERTSLNILMRMSGIATTTYNIQNQVKTINENIRVAGTRKTTPGFSKFDKLAISIGSGDPHRFALDDMILIKDNHIAIVGSVKKALEIAKKKASFTKKIEIEVENSKDAAIAAKNGADIVMLDNMDPNQVKETLAILSDFGLRENVLIEVSGGITQENILEYAKSGVDIISLGFLTHSIKSLDINLNIIIDS